MQTYIPHSHMNKSSTYENVCSQCSSIKEGERKRKERQRKGKDRRQEKRERGKVSKRLPILE